MPFRRALPALIFAASALCQPHPNPCPDPGAPIALTASDWNGWGRDLDNSHYQPHPGIQLADVSKLKLKWAFAYSGGKANGPPTVIGSRVFVTSESGHVYALNAQTGCTYWTFESPAPARTAVTIAQVPHGGPAKFAAYFGDEHASVCALDALTGRQLWTTQVDPHPIARITGSPVFYRDRLYVPVASLEEVSAAKLTYECCTFRGSLVAIDAAAGKVIWKTWVIPDAPQPLRKNSSGTQMYGPAGGGIWSAPTIDPARKIVYAGTGDSYTDASTKMTDAIVAFDLDKGAVQWFNQITPNDNWVVCQKPGEGNCPQNMGPDFDFGSSLILRRPAGGQPVLLAGQKSGVIMALDPQSRGRVLWQAKVGQGGSLGGIEFGIAADGQNVYVPMSDVNVKTDPQPGLTALQIATGKKLWHVPAPEPPCSWSPRTCNHAQSAAITAIPGVVFSGATDGHLRAYASEDGAVLWDFDTAAKLWDTVNGIAARGGVLDGGGPTVAGGMLFVNSGYGRMPGQPGNVLLAFSVDGK
ncbi:Polyvinylalcohol dehydrogenase [Candidatus Sulfopaludibacter sp. SbA4]|nr:Polyvinylalcohol dehydrogenase [Candidatus Sulfopaludibacter sp. SbA4]